ncbi:MAG: hypothetical protein Q7J09_05440 [Methanocalculus sp.]|uniref:hypothetical protein n=1 Tax=Methanocalculus sp. TaxID=2004547 RepID=UPI0027182AE8|nr:hypothetical protein [Methanocalculus sp.]MDO8842616.1 hypothetical protein [Methanocalculus sp.]MDO9539429.1 hypothetical protein [Methanocalculus sp.]
MSSILKPAIVKSSISREIVISPEMGGWRILEKHLVAAGYMGAYADLPAECREEHAPGAAFVMACFKPRVDSATFGIRLSSDMREMAVGVGCYDVVNKASFGLHESGGMFQKTEECNTYL